MKRLLLFFSISGISVILFSCADEKTKNQNDPTPIQPNIEGKWYTISIETKRWDGLGNQIENSKINPYPNHFFIFNYPFHFWEGAPGTLRSKGKGTFKLFGEDLYLEILKPDLLYSKHYVVDSLTNNRLVFHTTVSTSTSPADVKAITFRAKKI